MSLAYYDINYLSGARNISDTLIQNRYDDCCNDSIKLLLFCWVGINNGKLVLLPAFLGYSPFSLFPI